MNKVKIAAVAAIVGLALGVGSASSVMAKGHDQGVADGSRTDPSAFRGGAVAKGFGEGGGIGLSSDNFKDANGDRLCAPERVFCGVVGDPGQTYGRDIVATQRALDIRRVKPVVSNRPKRD